MLDGPESDGRSWDRAGDQRGVSHPVPGAAFGIAARTLARSLGLQRARRRPGRGMTHKGSAFGSGRSSSSSPSGGLGLRSRGHRPGSHPCSDRVRSSPQHEAPGIGRSPRSRPIAARTRSPRMKRACSGRGRRPPRRALPGRPPWLLRLRLSGPSSGRARLWSGLRLKGTTECGRDSQRPGWRPMPIQSQGRSTRFGAEPAPGRAPAGA